MDTDSSRLFSTDAAFERERFIESLDQLSDEDFWRAAQTLAAQESPLAATREYLECELSQHRCLLPLDALSEVCLPPRQYAFLPALPWWARGLAAWHGEVICVVDLAAYLSAHLSEQGQDEREIISSLPVPQTDYVPQTGYREGIDPPGMLLVALHHAIPIGLHVRAIGQTRAVEADLLRPSNPAYPTDPSPVAQWINPERAALVAGTLDDAVILDLSALLNAVMDAMMLITSSPERTLALTPDAINGVPTP